MVKGISVRDCVLLIDGFHELADDQGNTLYPLDLFLSSYKLSLQASAIHSGNDLRESYATGLPLLILDVFFLQVDVPIRSLVRG